jgi:NAD(P)-dependent dehydrogenase (short-subunit alcohol dehydrogenase family)
MSPRTAIVTGSTSGIGHAIAARLHADGMNVVVTGRDAARGQRVCDAMGERTAFVGLDLTVDGAAAELAQAALAHFGRIDVLVNNAGQDLIGELLDVPVAEIRHVFTVNAIAPITVLQETAKRMDTAGPSSTSARGWRRSACPR